MIAYDLQVPKQQSQQAPGGVPGCELAVLQLLPPEVFADPYELEGLQGAPGSAQRFQHCGPLDLEQ